MSVHNGRLRAHSVITLLARDDRGENSIMQVISIAVSAILIVAGLVAAPGLIQSARISNVKSDLNNLVTAQEFYQSNMGEYAVRVGDLTSQEQIKVLLSDQGRNISVAVNADGSDYCVLSEFTDGAWMSRSGSSTKTHLAQSMVESASASGCQLTTEAMLAKVNADIQLITDAILLTREKTGLPLKDITGTTCTACYTTNWLTKTTEANYGNTSYLPTAISRWSSALSKISAASGVNLKGIVDPYGRPYHLDENQGESGRTCGIDAIGHVRLNSFFTDGSSTKGIPLNGFLGCD